MEKRVEIKSFMQSASGAILAIPVDDKIQPFRLTAMEVLQYKIIDKEIILYPKKFIGIYGKDLEEIRSEAERIKEEQTENEKLLVQKEEIKTNI